MENHYNIKYIRIVSLKNNTIAIRESKLLATLYIFFCFSCYVTFIVVLIVLDPIIFPPSTNCNNFSPSLKLTLRTCTHTSKVAWNKNEIGVRIEQKRVKPNEAFCFQAGKAINSCLNYVSYRSVTFMIITFKKCDFM